MVHDKREDPASLATGKGTDGSVSMATEEANRYYTIKRLE
jgi:hypothetical protein